MFCSFCGNALASEPPVQCSSCCQRHWRNPVPCAGALVVRNRKLLLVRRAIEPFQGDWDIPGGFCDSNEHPAHCAVRETAEETGLVVRPVGFLGMWLDSYTMEGIARRVTLNSFYHAVPVDDREAIADDDAAEVGWFGADALPENIAFPTHARPALAAWKQWMDAGQLSGWLPDVTPDLNR